MGKVLLPRRLRAAVGVLTTALALTCAASAFAGDSVSFTRFSGAISGNTGGANNTVTVSLLRNYPDPAGGLPQRNAVDSFTTTASGTGAWSGTFAHHFPASRGDAIEVAVSGGSGTVDPLLTIGDSGYAHLTPAEQAGTFVQLDPSRQLDGNIAVASDGSGLDASCDNTCSAFAITVSGATTPFQPSGAFPLTPHATSATPISVTGRVVSGTTTVDFTDNAPLPSPLGADDTAPAYHRTQEPSCTLYIVSGEVTCGHLLAGSYTLTQLRGGSPIGGQILTVPARSSVYGYNGTYIPSFATSTPIGNIASGDVFALSSGAHRLSTMTVHPLTVQSSSLSTDPLTSKEGSYVTGGTCTPGLAFNDASSICTTGIIGTNDMQAYPLTQIRYDGGLIGGTSLPGQFDETSSGATEVDVRALTQLVPDDGQVVRNPIQASALVRYYDPGDLTTWQNNRPYVGDLPEGASRGTLDPVALSVAPIGSGAFVPVGNASAPGGLTLPALPPGHYVARFKLTDPRGDTETYDSRFTVQPTPAVPPTLAAARCTAKASSHLRASVARSSKPKKHKKSKKKASPVKVTLTCSTASGNLVTAWLKRGSTFVGDGSAVSRGGQAKITVTGKFVKGRYALITVTDGRGLAAEGNQVLTLR